MRVRARAILPLAVLVSIVAAAVVVRLSGAPRRSPAPTGVTSAPLASGPSAGANAPLRGEPSDAGAVRDGAAREIHGDARHTHRAHGRGPRAAHVAWSVAVGGPVEAQVTASVDEQTLYVASLDGAITALSRADGATRWRVSLGDRGYGTPCVGDDGTIYVGSDDKKLRAIDPRGNVAWAIETDGEVDTGPVLGPAGTIVFAAGHTVYAVRRGGDVAWRFAAKGKVYTSPAIAPPRITAPATASGGGGGDGGDGGDSGGQGLSTDGDAGARPASEQALVIFGAQDHRVYALRAASGLLAWSVDLGADVDGAPAIGDGGEIFVGTDDGEVVRLNDAGEIAWRTNVGGFVRGVLSVARNGDVLAGVYGPTPRQVRLEGTSGVIRGAFAVQGTGAREFGVHGGALEDDDGALYFGAQDDNVYAIDPDGRVRFAFRTGADVDAPITMLSDGSLVVASDDGKVSLLAK